MKRKRRHCLTLLELFIALALSSIILTSLLWFYSEINLLSGKIEQEQKVYFNKRFVEMRLFRLFSNTVNSNSYGNNYSMADFVFYTEKKDIPHVMKGISLVLTYENGSNRESDFSNHVLGRLYIDDKSRLCLATWPSHKKQVSSKYRMKKEILMENVRQMEFDFYVPLSTLTVDPKDIAGKDQKHQAAPGWNPEWRKEYDHLPSIVKIIITPIEGKETLFVFPLTDHDSRITYSTRV
jgi:hypothetical protein